MKDYCLGRMNCGIASLCKFFVMLAASAVLSGCVVPYSAPDEMGFSPDGKKVAFLWYDAIFAGLPVEDVGGGIMPETCYGHWAPAETTTWPPPGSRLEGKVITPNWENIHGFPPRFSPGSRYVSFATSARIVVVDTNQRQKAVRIEPQGEKESIVTQSWLSDSELVYAIVDSTGRSSFWGRDVAVANSPGRLICRLDCSEEPSTAQVGTTEIYWSPSGRWAIFNRYAAPKSNPATPGPHSFRACLLDAREGKVAELERNMSISTAAWKRDSSQALCVLTEDAENNTSKYHLCLLDAATGKMAPLPQVPQECTFLHGTGSRIEWTADGQHLITQDGHLVTLEPWSVSDVKEAFKLSFHSSWHAMPGRPDWLVVFEPEENNTYAVNFVRKQRIRLNDIATMSYAVSSDGRRLAHVNALKKLTVQDIVLPDYTDSR